MTLIEFQKILAPIYTILVVIFLGILLLQLRALSLHRAEQKEKPHTKELIISNCNIRIKHANVQTIGGLVCATFSMLMGNLFGVVLYCIVMGMGYKNERFAQRLKEETNS